MDPSTDEELLEKESHAPTKLFTRSIHYKEIKIALDRMTWNDKDFARKARLLGQEPPTSSSYGVGSLKGTRRGEVERDCQILPLGFSAHRISLRNGCQRQLSHF